ncbi:MAG: CoA-binding protein [bacterium]|nr:CoA-binding protein [bacterium]
MTLHDLFHPRSVALVGASSNPLSGGYAYAIHLVEDFRGELYLVNPNVEEILGKKAYPSLASIPGPVDYLVSSIAADRVLPLLDDCAEKGVKIIHFFTARMSETGRSEGAELEREITEKAKKLGIRFLGPNCMGLYNPRVGLTYGYWFPPDPGWVGGLFQSGGASTDFIHYGALRGLRFSRVVSYGNGADIDESELLEHFAADSETRVIAAYLEGARDGRRLAQALARAARTKPVVVLKGGKGEAGSRSVLSHTASLAGREEIWRAVFRQGGVSEVSSLGELVDQVLAFSFLPEFTGRRTAIVGGGGGKSALSADLWEKNGFVLPDLPPVMRARLKALASGVWDWLKNPVDVSILQDSPVFPEQLFTMMNESGEFDVFAFNLTEDDPIPGEMWKIWAGEQVAGVVRFREESRKPVVAVMAIGEVTSGQMQEWRWEMIGEVRKQLIDAKIPVFSSPEHAARAVFQVTEYYRRRQKPSPGRK